MIGPDQLASLPKRSRTAILRRLPEDVRARKWTWEARPNQILPLGDWVIWLILSGRGWGKTRTGAEAIIDWVFSGVRRIHLVARTAADYRDVMVEGESGILACSPEEDRPTWEPSNRRLTWPNGAQATCFSAEEPGQLRGPQCEKFWADELAAWCASQNEEITAKSVSRAEAAWSNLRIGARLGSRPQGVATTTPKPLKLLRELMAHPETHVTRGALFDNRANLSGGYLSNMRDLYEGTRMARQELHGELLEDVEGALWSREWFDRDRREHWPDLVRVVVAIDPAVTSGPDSDDTGIVVAGLGVDGRGYVIADRTCKLSPQGWAERGVRALYEFHADSLIAERNNGGDLVEQNIRLVDPNIPVRLVWASRGKVKRAEPVALLYEQGRISHVGQFDELEDEMSRFTHAGGFDLSPNRADALVWALWALFIEGREIQMGGVGVTEDQAVRISVV